MMMALLILPVVCRGDLLASPTGWWRRVWQMVILGASVLVAAGWWVVAVALTPAADRPYVGGTQDNSFVSMIFGYNGFGRLGTQTMNVSGRSVSSKTAGPGQRHSALLCRLRQHDVVAATGIAHHGRPSSWRCTLRAGRTDRERACAGAVGRFAVW